MERLLIETDAPSFLPIAQNRSHRLDDPSVNHPANIEDAYPVIAQAIEVDTEDMTKQIAQNFKDFFEKVNAAKIAYPSNTISLQQIDGIE